jgi:mannose-6-phosphate isomerase-like protein (cupin superfamily)
MKSKLFTFVAFTAVLCAAASLPALGAGQAAVTAKADLQWKEMGTAGVAAAPVSGDMDKGPSRFFLKYPKGLVTPMHHHTADHYATVVSGSITLTVNGKEHKLGPGSYFALTGQASHSARVEGNEEAVFFIQADGPWDVVADK